MSHVIDTPQIAFPFEIMPNGRVREVEQDSLDEIAMSVEIILRFPIGSRAELTAFGVPDPSFRLSTEDLGNLLAEHITRWESRARIFIEERPEQWNQMVRDFTIRVEGRVGQ
jgi:phage baseplate assembly protein W